MRVIVSILLAIGLLSSAPAALAQEAAAPPKPKTLEQLTQVKIKESA